MFGFGVDKEIRLEEQLTELVEQYGIPNVKKIIAKIEANPPATKQQNLEADKEVLEEKQPAPKIPESELSVDMKSNANYQAQIEKEKAEEDAKPKSNLPPNVKNLEDFVRYASGFPRDKVREYILQKLKYFVDNARLVQAGQFDKIDKSFATDLTEKDLFGDIASPEEDWLEYNANIIKKQIKQKLRPYGYDFLDLDFEVGKKFDPNRHNCVGTVAVDSPTKEGRVVKVVKEGLIIDKVLHINAGVIVGKFKPGS